MSRNVALVVAAVRQLPGVSAAEGDHDASGSVTALRVWLAPDADGAQVEAAVRRVTEATALAADRVRIVDGAAAQDDGPAAAVAPAPPLDAAARGRPQIVRTEVTTVGPQVTSTVVLEAHGRPATGHGRGAVTGSGVPRAVAAAAAQALEGLLPDGLRLELEDVQVERSGQDAVALVQLSLVRPGGVDRLSGAAVVRTGETDAVVRAVLDASNRRAGSLLA